MRLLCVALLTVFVALLVGAEHAVANGHPHEDGGRAMGPGEPVPLAFRLYRFVHPLGIATYVSLWITFLLGLLKFKFRVQRISMGWHWAFAILTLGLATLHASLVVMVD